MIKCHDCRSKFKTEEALTQHAKVKHPKQLQARADAVLRPIRKARGRNLFWGAIGGFFGALLAVSLAIGIAAQAKALSITPEGKILLNPWAGTVTRFN